MNTIILVYVTTPSSEVAQSIAQHLLNKKLIACANIHASTSMYWWENAIQSAQESIIIAKTFEHHFEEVTKEVLSIHPYKIPCIFKLSAEAIEPFKEWMLKEIK